VDTGDGGADRLLTDWEKAELTVPLTVLDSPFRDIVRPLTGYIRDVRRESPRDLVVVFLPEYLVRHWWEAGSAQPDGPAYQDSAAVHPGSRRGLGTLAARTAWGVLDPPRPPRHGAHGDPGRRRRRAARRGHTPGPSQ